MKKLLLLSLLVLGANSFGAITGDEVAQGQNGIVTLPIRSTANVVAVTGKSLVISSETSGMSGNTMEFNFGDIQTNKELSQSLDGRFTVKLADESAFTKEGDSASTSEVALALSFNNSDFSSAGKKIKTTGDADGVLATNAEINYTMTGSFDSAMKQYNGVVNAVLNITGGGIASAGRIVDNTQNIYAKLSVGASGY